MNPLNYPNLLLAVQTVKRGTRDNVVDDAIDGLYRLLSQRVISVDCCGNSVNKVNFSSIFTDVGSEGVGTVALIPPEMVIADDRGYQTAGGSARFTWMAKGRPDPKAEILMNSVRSRTSVYIWHRVIDSIRCSNGKPVVSLKLENSKFPSADLFYRIDGGPPVKAGAYAQGTMSLLWNADPGILEHRYVLKVVVDLDVSQDMNDVSLRKLRYHFYEVKEVRPNDGGGAAVILNTTNQAFLDKGSWLTLTNSGWDFKSIGLTVKSNQPVANIELLANP